MGGIVFSRREERNNVLVEIQMNKQEFRQLGGAVDDVHLFSEDVVGVPSRVSLRGRNEATKYFLIPRQLRRRLAVHGEVSCQRIESSNGKSIFIYVIDPFKEKGSRIAPLASESVSNI